MISMANANAKSTYNLTNGTPPVVDLIKLYQGSLNVREQLDQIVRDTGYGSMSTINYLTLSGFNYLRHGQQLVHNNRDNMGYVFFTRPILNLTYDNLSNVSSMVRLRNAPPMSIEAMVRGLLDPWGQNGFMNQGNNKGNAKTADQISKDAQTCPLVNRYNPFIPIMSNTLTSLTGFKDLSLNTYTSKAGAHNEQWAMADGFFYKTEAFELSSSFRNIEGDPISLLIETWLKYMAACRQENEMFPYPCFVEEREFDYNTRIYRFVMDHTRKYIQKFCATIAFPISLSYGNTFNYSYDKNFIDSNAEISVSWQCVGTDYNEPVLVYEFNNLVAMYCPDLAIDYTRYDTKTNSLVVKGMEYWQKLQDNEKNRGLFMAIPLINHVTYELEWWIPKTHYVQYVLQKKDQNYTQRGKILQSPTRAASPKTENPITHSSNRASLEGFI